MKYKLRYKTPESFSDIILIAENNCLTGLFFEGSHDKLKHCGDFEENALPIFDDAVRWLDIYFSGKQPDFTPKYEVENLTDFRKEVIDIILSIPYGKTITYGEIAAILAKKRNLPKMSAQAVGGAVGWNPICLIIPCHRVIGSNGSITGYGGGIPNKIALLELEGLDTSVFTK